MYPDESEFEEVYSDGGRADMVDNDEMSADEEAFMSGYDEERNKTAAQDELSEDDDDPYEKAFAKKRRRRSKRQSQSFDAEEIEAEVTLR
ncbi:MAG: hypothetical protein ACLFTH_02110 [Candidatus Woesearchaeota archaeon]